MKLLGVYGSKNVMVPVLRSIGAVDEDAARSLVDPTNIGGPPSGLSSRLYITRANATRIFLEGFDSVT
ncbi:hypothetical protein BJV77DRAFT_452581 [Russula vinacea]|nr:hypothetical protein BJV77DRAFT_452581 [Russula vinacea]